MLKKLFLAAAFVACSLGANAQIWMGGSLGLGLFKYNDADKTQTTFSIKPEIGYTLNEKWDLGIGLGFSSISNMDCEKGESQTKIVVAPYARYTFAQTGKVGFFVDGGVDFGFINDKYDEGEKESTSDFWVGLRPGLKYAASDKVSIVAHLGSFGFRSQKDCYSNFGLGLDVDNTNLSFGIYWSL
ncbi:MAG: outer membrane beta-barrel protein [Bacteroidales bacterium]|nr:outer membrane beta-barrel protein [Candidatus Equimonas enterica]